MSSVESEHLQSAVRRRRSQSTSTSDGKMTMKNTSAILKNLRAAMKNTKHVTEVLHAYIIPSEDAHQSEYIAPCDARRGFVTGFTGSNGFAAVTQTDAALWTDGRYFLQARQQMDANWTLMKMAVEGTPTLEKWLGEKVADGGRVGVDPKLISADKFRSLRYELSQRNLVLLPVPENLVDLVWGAEKPPEPLGPIFHLPLDFVGRSWQDKIGEIRKEMETNKAKLLVLSALDEIAWTFNLRGSDIDYNPLFFAYSIIGIDFVSLFIYENKITEELARFLQLDSRSENCGGGKTVQNGGENADSEVSVALYPYDSVLDYLDRNIKECILDPADKVWLPLESTSQAVAGIVPELKDAVAHCEFLCWLERQMKEAKGSENAGITEVTAAAKFEELRQEQEAYISLSFETISSVGPHASVIHYAPSPETDAPIRADQVYLCDSGAHYKDGTTDVTRTVCFSEPTAYQKQCNTLMVKGHIALATQRFPEGCSGIRLDCIARLQLWDVGLDFRHGVGHGVGHVLNVHEGPASVGYRSAASAKHGIKENFVLTIEPGYYEDNQFGCRFENVYVVVSATTKYSSPETKFLTFEPLTLVPIDTKLLDPAMLNEKEVLLIQWLNEYHEKCLGCVGPLLERQGKTAVLNWLCDNTKPLG